MISHPEEFHSSPFRWHEFIAIVQEFGSEQDKDTLNAAHNRMRMDHAYEDAMDELLNGDERRVEHQQTVQKQLLDNRIQRAISNKHMVAQQAIADQCMQQAYSLSSLGNSLDNVLAQGPSLSGNLAQSNPLSGSYTDTLRSLLRRGEKRLRGIDTV